MSAAGASTGDNAGTNQRKTNRKEDAVVRMIAAEASTIKPATRKSLMKTPTHYHQM